MSAEDDRTLHEKIGYMRAEIKGVTEKVDKVLDKVDCVDGKLVQLNGSTVKQEQCAGRTGELARKFEALQGEVATKMPVVDSQPQEVYEEEEELPPRINWLTRIRENIISIVAILGFLSLLGTGFYKFAHFLVRFESVSANQGKEAETQLRAIKQEIHKITTPPKVIYLPVYPDAGTKKPLRPRHKNR